MNPQEFGYLIKAAHARCPKFAPNFSDDAILSIWFNEFKSVSVHLFNNVLNEIVRSQDEFPSLQQLLKACGLGVMSIEEKADKLTAKIMEICPTANHNPQGVNKAIGPIGWRAVKRVGNWNGILQSIENGTPQAWNLMRSRLYAVVLEEMQLARTSGDNGDTNPEYLDATAIRLDSRNIIDAITAEQAESSENAVTSRISLPELFAKARELPPPTLEEQEAWEKTKRDIDIAYFSKRPRMWEYENIGGKEVRTGRELVPCGSDGIPYVKKK